MNIKVQCCGLIILFVIFLFYKEKKTLYTNTEKAFWRLFSAAILCISLDILSVIVITDRSSLPIFLVKAICKVYLASIVGVMVLTFIYLCTDVFLKNNKYKYITAFLAVIYSLFALIILILPIGIHEEKEGSIVYTEGPCVLATYAISLALLLTIIAFMICKRKVINHGRLTSLFIWLALWIIAALSQFLFNELLLVGYACSLGILIIFLQFENPELLLDQTTTMFNLNAYNQFTKQLYYTETPFAALSVSIDTHIEDGISYESVSLFQRMSDYFYNFPNAYAFKISEDEIVILLVNTKNTDSIINDIKNALDNDFKASGNKKIYTNLLFFPSTNILSNGTELLALLRYAKDDKKDVMEQNFILIEDSVVTDMNENKMMEQLMLDAINNDRVVAYYQPIYSTKEQRFTSAEALIRIYDEDGKIIPPYKFIDIAEKNGMIIQLGEIVFEKVCQTFKNHHLEQFGIKYIEVNLSVVQCAYESLASDYIRIMEKYNLNPRYINLEITESASLNAKNILLENMKVLMNYGVKFSLDDFGTGQSNLNYIVEMPVSIVKFDKDMTHAYFKDIKAKYVMDAAMNMIKGMQLEIVSEGIETEEHFNTASKLGIDYIQGYYFSKPLPEDEFIQFISDHLE